ncbi:hypothetical protein ACFLRT_03445 [Acidobacteriota bacterium]
MPAIFILTDVGATTESCPYKSGKYLAIIGNFMVCRGIHAVSVAARIEAISIPGAVLFSDKVFDDIKNHPEFHADSLGEFKFKFFLPVPFL